VELDMKKDIKSTDNISKGTLHEILLDIKYRLDHIEDITADDRATLIKLVKQTNMIVKFLKQVEINDDIEYDKEPSFEPPGITTNQRESKKVVALRELVDEFMERRENLKEFEKELKKNKIMLTPGQIGEA
jgi:hypothetical protein